MNFHTISLKSRFIHLLNNLYINESPRNGKKNESLRNHHQSGSPGPGVPALGPAAATAAAPFHLYSGGGSLSFYSFFHFGCFHLCINYIKNVCVKISKFNWCVKKSYTTLGPKFIFWNVLAITRRGLHLFQI